MFLISIWNRKSRRFLLLLASGTDGCLLGTLDTFLTVAQLLSLLAGLLLNLLGEAVTDESVITVLSYAPE